MKNICLNAAGYRLPCKYEGGCVKDGLFGANHVLCKLDEILILLRVKVLKKPPVCLARVAFPQYKSVPPV